jgi:putative nucleotidyltransferase with HDIG domain
MMMPVSTATLRADVVLGFDLYLKISGKNLLYVRRNDNLEQTQQEKLHQKNVREVFIAENDRLAYEEFLRGSLKLALSPDNIMALEDRANIVSGQAKAAVEGMFANPESRENYKAAEQAAAGQVSFLKKFPEALALILERAKSDQSVYQHSVNVASIALGIAHWLEAPEEACDIMALAGLLHDIGKRENPQMGAEHDDGRPGDSEYLQHARAGASFLVGKPYVSKDVLDIILFHEERIDGKGYPSGVKKLDQIFQVVGLANFYDRLVTIRGWTPEKAFDYIEGMRPHPYEPDLIDGLKEVLVKNKILK